MQLSVPEHIDLISFAKGTKHLTPALCAALAEAAAVCLRDHTTENTTTLTVNQKKTRLTWSPVDTRAPASHADTQEATEDGAVAVAMSIIRASTEYEVVKRSPKRTGFDWYLSHNDKNQEPFQGSSCLEVSGILRDTPVNMNQRVKEKRKQVERGGGEMPGFVVVVGFASPTARVESFS